MDGQYEDKTSHLGLTFKTVDEIVWSSLSKDYTTT